MKVENFRLYEDGIPQQIDFFSNVNEQVSVLLLLDLSGSMSAHLGDFANSSSVFIKQLRPNDQIMSAAFGEQIQVLIPLTKVSEVPNQVKLRLMATYIDTMIYDAVEFGIKKMAPIRGRKAIVVFSDAVGSGLSASAKSNLRDAEEQETLIYTIQFRFSTPTLTPEEAKKRFRKQITNATTYMKSLAEKTGGRHYMLEEIKDLGEAFKNIANELSQQYSVGYYPKLEVKKGERRRISVKVNIPNAVVRSRNDVVY